MYLQGEVSGSWKNTRALAICAAQGLSVYLSYRVLIVIDRMLPTWLLVESPGRIVAIRRVLEVPQNVATILGSSLDCPLMEEQDDLRAVGTASANETIAIKGDSIINWLSKDAGRLS